jgi:predicted transcriptional regulator
MTPWYHSGIMSGMAMTLRLTDEETALLRRRAEREGRSMHEVVRLAIQERIAVRTTPSGSARPLAAWRRGTRRSSTASRTPDDPDGVPELTKLTERLASWANQR